MRLGRRKIRGRSRRPLTDCRGMKTVYIQRKTEDPNEDMEIVCQEFDMFIDGTVVGTDHGFARLAHALT